MKNNFLLLLAILLILICITCLLLINIRAENTELKRENAEYEQYLNKEISGTELASLIDKVIDENKKNNVQKDDKEYFIENNENSIKIDLKMTTIDKTYPMEEIYNNEMTEFVKNFSTIKFKCTSIEYHKKTGKISKMVFEELE